MENIASKANEYAYINYSNGRAVRLSESALIIEEDTLISGLERAFISGAEAQVDNILEIIPRIYVDWLMESEPKPSWINYARLAISRESEEE